MNDFHIVRKGDTLSAIARKYGSTVPELGKINALSDPNRLRIGQRIALRKEAVLGFEALFLDADRNPIKNLDYLLEFNGKQIGGSTGVNGKTLKIMTETATDQIRILVKRFDGTLKEIGRVASGYGNKLCTLISPLVVVEGELKPDRRKSGKIQTSKEPLKPAHAASPAAGQKAAIQNIGFQTKPGFTPEGWPLTLVDGDKLVLDFLSPFPLPDKLNEADFIAAANELHISKFHIKAVIEVEAAGRFFWTIKSSGRRVPPILFERHKFSKHTAHRFDDRYPDISSRKTGGYAGNLSEYKRLGKAVHLDKEAALKSASWGAFQIMGEHYAALGFSTAEAFVRFNSHSEKNQLHIFVKACQDVQKAWQKALRNEDWEKFARSYNGPNYWKNRYDKKLEAAYARLTREES